MVNRHHALFNNQCGAIHALLILPVTLGVICGFGIWGYFRQWRFHMETQLRLDRCIGEKAKDLQDTLNSIQSDNRKIRASRLLIQAAVTTPHLIPPLRVAQALVVGHQEFILLNWKRKAVQWIAQLGCSGKGDRPSPLPFLELSRDFSDLYGFKVLEWKGKAPKQFQLQIAHSPRTAAALVFLSEKTFEKPNDGELPDDDLELFTLWKVRWTAPQKPLWSNIP